MSRNAVLAALARLRAAAFAPACSQLRAAPAFAPPGRPVSQAAHAARASGFQTMQVGHFQWPSRLVDENLAKISAENPDILDNHVVYGIVRLSQAAQVCSVDDAI